MLSQVAIDTAILSTSQAVIASHANSEATLGTSEYVSAPVQSVTSILLAVNHFLNPE